jgi:AcrR family transcriptional regulator
VTDSAPLQPSTLRERKKQITRRMLVDAAVELCVKQGYENTTVEQIASAADISTRTFSRYFATKEAVFIAVLDDLATEIAAELVSQPADLGPMEALRASHMAVLGRVSRRPLVGLTKERIALILRIVNSSDALRQAAIDYRFPAAMNILATRMGVAPDDKRLDLAVALFSTTIVSACSDVVDGAEVELGPDVVMERLGQTLGQVAQFAADMDVDTRT